MTGLLEGADTACEAAAGAPRAPGAPATVLPLRPADDVARTGAGLALVGLPAIRRDRGY